MIRPLLAAALALAAAPLSAAPLSAAPLSDQDLAALRDAALNDTTAYAIVEGLTTEIGPRPTGSANVVRSRDWAVARLRAMGFRNVRIEPYEIDAWARGEERAEVLGPFPQGLHVTALGNSGATPAGGLSLPVTLFRDLAALRAAPDGSLKGRIAYVGHYMTPSMDGASYGPEGQARRAGPALAAQKGAAALLIKSIGTDHSRAPHTGATMFPAGVTPIPAAALSVSDAGQLERIAARGQEVRIRLTLTPRRIGKVKSGNVIAEVPGSDPAAGIVVIGGHLDSWDLGTGAIDDAAGVAITTAAAKRVMDAGPPRRTIRVVWFGDEEVGLVGGMQYAKAHAGERHALAAESDFGADRVYKVDFALPAAAAPLADRIAAALRPLGITRSGDRAGGGPDLGPLAATGVPAIDLGQDGTRYFDIHHTADDTLDRIDPKQLAQNVAAWTTMLSLVANAPEDWGAMPPASTAR